MFQFKYTKNELHHKYFPRFCIDIQLCFTICRNFKNAYFTELLPTGFYCLPGFSNKSNATRYSVVECCPIVNQNIVKSRVKFKINYASKNEYNCDKLQLSLFIYLFICLFALYLQLTIINNILQQVFFQKKTSIYNVFL